MLKLGGALRGAALAGLMAATTAPACSEDRFQLPDTGSSTTCTRTSMGGRASSSSAPLNVAVTRPSSPRVEAMVPPVAITVTAIGGS